MHKPISFPEICSFFRECILRLLRLILHIHNYIYTKPAHKSNFGQGKKLLTLHLLLIYFIVDYCKIWGHRPTTQLLRRESLNTSLVLRVKLGMIPAVSNQFRIKHRFFSVIQFTPVGKIQKDARMYRLHFLFTAAVHIKLFKSRQF